MTFLHSGYSSQINLSAKEMLEISQEISRNFTPCFSSRVPEPVGITKLSSRELLDIGEEIGRDFAPKPSCATPEVMLLPVDPGHFYAYWNLGKNAAPENAGKGLLTLRIYAQSARQEADAGTVSWFDVAIDSPATHQQVSLPGPANETEYSAAIGKCGADDGFVEFAHSNVIHAHCGQTLWLKDTARGLYKNASGLGIGE